MIQSNWYPGFFHSEIIDRLNLYPSIMQILAHAIMPQIIRDGLMFLQFLSRSWQIWFLPFLDVLVFCVDTCCSSYGCADSLTVSSPSLWITSATARSHFSRFLHVFVFQQVRPIQIGCRLVQFVLDPKVGGRLGCLTCWLTWGECR